MPWTSEGLVMTLEFLADDAAAGTATVLVESLCIRAETPAPAPAPASTAAATTAANQLRGRAGAGGNDAGFGGDPPPPSPGSPGWGSRSPGSGRTRSSEVSSVVTNVMGRYSGPDLGGSWELAESPRTD